MTLLNITHFARSDFHNDSWVVSYIRPEGQSSCPEKYRITFDCHGFNRSSIDTRIEDGNKLVITAKEGSKPSQDTQADFYYSQLQRTFHLPRYVDAEQLVSFFLPSESSLFLEMPIHLAQKWHKKTLTPHVSHDGKTVKFEVVLPENLDEKTLRIDCKARDVILVCDYKDEKSRKEGEKKLVRVQYLRKATFPENTCFETLTSRIDNGEVYISADLNPIEAE